MTDYDITFGKCERKVTEDSEEAWCRTHASRFPFNLTKCTRSSEGEEAAGRLLGNGRGHAISNPENLWNRIFTAIDTMAEDTPDVDDINAHTNGYKARTVALYGSLEPEFLERVAAHFEHNAREQRERTMSDCGGCRGEGSHKRWCASVVGRPASMLGPWSEQMEEWGDRIGGIPHSQNSANLLYSFAAVIEKRAHRARQEFQGWSSDE